MLLMIMPRGSMLVKLNVVLYVGIKLIVIHDYYFVLLRMLS